MKVEPLDALKAEITTTSDADDLKGIQTSEGLESKSGITSFASIGQPGLTSEHFDRRFVLADMASEDLTGKGFRLVNGVWVSEALLYMLERIESAEAKRASSKN